MKKIMSKLLGSLNVMLVLALLLSMLFVFGSKAEAGVTVSSTSRGGPCPVILLNPNETLFWTLASTSAGMQGEIVLEKSFRNNNWIDTEVSSITQGGIAGSNGPHVFFSSGILQAADRPTYFRWNIISSTGGAFVTTLEDRDDIVQTVSNNKRVAITEVYDDSLYVRGSVRVNGYQSQISSNSLAVFISSAQTINRTTMATRELTVIQSTANGFMLTGQPTISTASAVNGDRLSLMSNTSAFYFQDNTAYPGSGVKVGSRLRALGLGDIITFIFYNGLWYEQAYTHIYAP